MVPLPCLGSRHTADNVAIADGHCNQWQQKETAEDEEVVDDLLPLSLEAAFGDTPSEGTWTSASDGTEQEQLDWSQGLLELVSLPFPLPSYLPIQHGLLPINSFFCVCVIVKKFGS